MCFRPADAGIRSRIFIPTRFQRSHLPSAWKHCDLIVTERDIIQQLILNPCLCGSPACAKRCSQKSLHLPSSGACLIFHTWRKAHCRAVPPLLFPLSISTCVWVCACVCASPILPHSQTAGAAARRSTPRYPASSAGPSCCI